MENSLYNLLEMKTKHSIFKSVFITGRKTLEGYPIVEVEPYDDTFLNAIKSVKKYDNTLDRIIEKVWKYMDGKETWLSVSTDEHGHIEILLNSSYIKNLKEG